MMFLPRAVVTVRAAVEQSPAALRRPRRLAGLLGARPAAPDHPAAAGARPRRRGGAGLPGRGHRADRHPAARPHRDDGRWPRRSGRRAAPWSTGRPPPTRCSWCCSRPPHRPAVPRCATESGPMSALTVQELTKSFGSTPVLTGVDLHVPSGSLAALLGPSGCGKTTLLRLVAGFDDPDTGTIAVGDRVVARRGRVVPARDRGIGFVAAGGRPVPAPERGRQRHLRAAAPAAPGPRAGARPAGARRARRRPRRPGAAPALRRAAAAGGPRPRAGARARRSSCSTSRSPPSTRACARRPARPSSKALRAAGATAVLVTHDQAEALSMADQVAVLRGGRLVQLTDPANALPAPERSRRRHVRGRGRGPRRRRPRRAGAVRARSGAARPASSRTVPPASCSDPSSSGSRAPPRGRCRPACASVDFYGHDSRVRLELPGGVVVSSRLEGVEVPSAGDEVAVTVAGSGLPFPAGAARSGEPEPARPGGAVDVHLEAPVPAPATPAPLS